MADWSKIQAEYLTTDISIRDLGQKYGVHYTTIAKKASKEGWQTQRQQQANRTLTKILTADANKKADRATRLMTVADKLLDKVELYVDSTGMVTPTSAKNMADALKSIKEVCMVRTNEDIEEQKARIAKLQREAEKDDKSASVTVIIEGDRSYGE